MASGNIETEIKLAVHDPQSASTLLAAHGFEIRKPRVFESNIVFDTPAKTLRSAGCLLRLRIVDTEYILTFKGPGTQTRHKSREEIEVHVSDPASTSKILECLGYHATFRYEKYRTEFALSSHPGVVTLDETPVGVFLELEGSPDWIDRTARILGFEDRNYITVSYGELYRRYCQSLGETPSHMVFKPTECS
jgi:adenylate cyclase class 2